MDTMRKRLEFLRGGSAAKAGPRARAESDAAWAKTRSAVTSRDHREAGLAHDEAARTILAGGRPTPAMLGRVAGHREQVAAHRVGEARAAAAEHEARVAEHRAAGTSPAPMHHNMGTLGEVHRGPDGRFDGGG